MLHARADYQNIQQCDKTLLRELFVSLVAHIDPAFIEQGKDRGIDVRQEVGKVFEAAVAETIPSDEPVFLIRAQDLVSGNAVRAWAHLHNLNGGQDAAFEAAMALSVKMDEWPKKKLADMPEGDAAASEADNIREDVAQRFNLPVLDASCAQQPAVDPKVDTGTPESGSVG